MALTVEEGKERDKERESEREKLQESGDLEYLG